MSLLKQDVFKKGDGKAKRLINLTFMGPCIVIIF
jgi:hypothetical protein